MPRGKPKRGQFAFKLWFPDGSSINSLFLESYRDLTPEEWRTAVMDQVKHVLRLIEPKAQPATEVQEPES